ncbi:MAG TPA: cupin domain-containing protein [Opitutaceae bacterium]|nr:cupin domain-containing protein [Opitutaceae bacterium]
MPLTGEVHINPVTGERAVVRVNPTGSGEDVLIADLYIRPGGAVVGEHVHPAIEESFTVVHGQVGFSVNGRKDVAGPGRTLVVPAGAAHDWWNAGPDEALVRVKIRPGARFQQMIMNIYGLARDGKTNRKGMPNLFQLALISQEFADVVYFTNPPRPVQRVLFALLAPIGRLLGYRGSYPHYVNHRPAEVAALEDRAGFD